MIMESPVRICLGATLVVHLLLLMSTFGSGNALPLETTSATIRDEKSSRFTKTNSTWTIRTKPKIPDAAQNELRKDSASEEHTDKNAKYKDRGRVRFNPLAKSTTESTLRRVTISTASEGSHVIIVTPTPEVKRPAQIIDSMRTYKKTKMPTVGSSTPSSVFTELKFESDEDFDSDEEDNISSFEKYSSIDDFFTIPSFDSDIYMKKDKRGSHKKHRENYSTPSFSDYSSFFPEGTFSSKDEPYKSQSFFEFERELTTPKNEFFDKKFLELTSSIINNLDKNKSPPPINATKKHEHENIGLKRYRNGTPNNKSTVIIKNTKEFRVFDNDEAETTNKELSDVHGTSIYYEMSVLSTETYNISHSDEDDCDNDTVPSDALATTTKEDIPYIGATLPTILETPTKPTIPDPIPEAYSTISSNIIQDSITPSILNSISSIPYSTQNTISPADNVDTKVLVNSSIPYSTRNSISLTEAEKHKVFPSSSISYSTQDTLTLTESERKKNLFSSLIRSRNYSKRLNIPGNKDSPNSVTVQTDQIPFNPFRSMTRKFHYTTPKIKPIWMAPRKNITRGTYTRSTYPTTIYSEHFNIKDKISTTLKPSLPTKTVLTTSPSDIDPVLQSDVSGYKKIVHSPSFSDNTIPTLWKRGSTKFSTAAATSTETESSISEMEIPPTLTAWALASLRSPPSLVSPVVNSTGMTQKGVDENELQKVGEVIDKKNSTTSPTTTTSGILNNEILPKNVNNTELSWKSLFISSSPNSNEVLNGKSTESKLETQPAESNISLQNSPQPPSTAVSVNKNSSKTTESNSVKGTKPSWLSMTKEKLDKAITEKSRDTSIVETIPPVDATKSTGFESITKLPAGITTPMDETAETLEDKNENISDTAFTKFAHTPTTTDYEITTIRFSYVPTEKVTENTEADPTTIWHPIIPTRTKPTTVEDSPITTYRPIYISTTNTVEESTTIIIDTTQKEDVSSQLIDNETKKSIGQDKNNNDNDAIDVATENLSTTPTITEPHDESTDVLETTTLKISTTYQTESKTNAPTQNIEEEKITANTEGFTKTQTYETDAPLIHKNDTPQTEINETEAPQTSIYETETPQIDTYETDAPHTETHEMKINSEESSGSNEIIQPTTRVPNITPPPITEFATPPETFTTIESTTKLTTGATEPVRETTTETIAKIVEVTTDKEVIITSTDERTTTEDYTGYSEMTTESSSRVLADEAGSGAAVAIAVSTIGVIALVLLVGLLLVVRRRGRRGVYAQRCTPVSLDAYSLDSVSVGQRKGNQRLRASKRSYGNPAYDDEVTSHPMNYAALANFALDVDSMLAEFSEIPSVTVRPDEVPPGCEDKNRYSNVLPLPETRVPLRRIGNDPTSEYINANYVTGPGNIRNYYIMCQAPLANTVVDFWRMVWEQNSRVVVMLTEYMENGVEKCYEYLPPSEISDNRRTFAEFQIILKKREQRDKYAISSVQLINLATRTWREVTHLWYFWPAKGVPDDYDSVIDFLSEMRSYMKISQNAKEYDEEGVEVIYGDQSRSSYNNLSKLRSDNGSGNGLNVYSPAKAEEMMRRGHTTNGTNGTLGRMKAASEIEAVRPCVVVCASGAGRSAAVVAADVCARALAAGAADVPRTVRDLRSQRPQSLSNRHHYIFVYKVLSEYGNRLMGGGVDTI